MTSPFDVPVPEADLERPAFVPLPTGEYRATLQPGSTIEDWKNGGGKRLLVPFSNFRSQNGGLDRPNAQIAARYNIEGIASEKARAVTTRQITAMGRAFGLTEQSQTADGKPAHKLTATKYAEFVTQLNAMAGSEVEVYVETGPRVRDGEIQYKPDGATPWIDTEIRRVSAIKAAEWVDGGQGVAERRAQRPRFP